MPLENKSSQVVVYTTAYCPYCHAAKNFLKSKNINFKEIDVSNDDAMRQKLVKMSGMQTVPQIFIDGKSIGGYDDMMALYQSGKLKF